MSNYRFGTNRYLIFIYELDLESKSDNGLENPATSIIWVVNRDVLVWNPGMDELTKTQLATVGALLEERLRVIGDRDWRERDQPGHLEALKKVAVEIEAAKKQVPRGFDQELTHYLERCSFDKALERIRGYLG